MRSVLTFLLVLICFASNGEVIVIGKKLPYQSLGKSVTYLKDAKSGLSLAQVIRADQDGRFIQSAAEVLNFGNSNAAYWVKISYVNTTQDDAYLVVDLANIEVIDYYAESAPGKFRREHTGSIAPLNPDVVTGNKYIFTLPESAYPGGIETVYLRVKSENILLLPIKIALSEQLIAGINKVDRFEAITIGILMALFLFNVSVYFKSKDLTYLFYSIRILALFIYMIFYFLGYAYLLGGEFRYLLNTHPHLFLGLGSIAGIAFSYRFLNLRVTLPWSLKIIYALTAAWMVLIVISALGYKSAGSNISQALSPLTIITLWGLGLAAYIKGYKLALYFVISWSFVCISTTALVFCLAGILPYNENFLHFVPLGFIFELLLLSLALGDRLKEMKRARLQEHAAKLKVQEENLYLIGSQNERLEKIVDSRTRALKKMVQSLEAANADKTRIFSIIAHDLRSPFNSLISLFSLNDMDLLTFDDVKMLLNDSRKNVDNIHNTLNNLLYWAQSQMKGITTAPSRFNVRVMVEDLMLVYQPLISKKNIRMEIAVDDDADVFADLNQINLVIRNLLDNAIKFTPLGYYIRIRIWGSQNHVFIDVCNPVTDQLNIDQFIRKEHSEPSYGTSNERGVGLGLHLCRDFVAKNKGILKVSKEDDCVVLRFNLPKFRIESSPAVEAELAEKA
ncbi:Signal transduction histidine kinase [Pedobacter westerhofensis]|uniref:histidine kinase n=1 Tax=Pedobacter westerhofensis TaxID=425512 RepID=A0A521CWL2_9SPHI|nr:sensor histidine kinase [Pedobacter westerhofensis]SMO63845.1 Signal transduction histidine kinase [Pedobacter westerhofensis]